MGVFVSFTFSLHTTHSKWIFKWPSWKTGWNTLLRFGYPFELSNQWILELEDIFRGDFICPACFQWTLKLAMEMITSLIKNNEWKIWGKFMVSHSLLQPWHFSFPQYSSFRADRDVRLLFSFNGYLFTHRHTLPFSEAPVGYTTSWPPQPLAPPCFYN